MDIRQQTEFQQVDRRYADLERQRDAGSISEKDFEAQRQQMMVLDDEGRWWSKSARGGEWHYHDGSAWIRGNPPSYRNAVPEPSNGRPQPSGAGGKRRKAWPRFAAAAIVVVGLAGIGPLAWSFLPPMGQLLPDLGGANAGGNPGGTGFDAVFVHRAVPDNIAANNTFLDDPSINDNPEAILYVTQHWNPGGGEGTYNDHAIGVWYDEGRGRWAIFNQDREGMTENAAFNVFVLEGPPE